MISLYHLVKGLSRDQYEPHVVLRASNDYAPRFRSLGVDVMTVAKDDRASGPTISTSMSVSPGAQASSGNAKERWAGLRRSRLVRWLKRSGPGERFVHFAGFYLRTYGALRRQARVLGEIMETVRPDLVHLNDVVCVSRAGIMAARKARIPAICHLRAMAWRTYFDRRLSRSLRGYVCISKAIDRYQRELGGRVAPSWIVYNGLDLDEFEENLTSARVRAELGLTQSIVVGCVGRLVAWKGQHIFLQALAKLAPDYPRLRALIVGAAQAHEQEYARELVRLTHELGLDGVAAFTGFRRDMPELLGAMDIMVHASTSAEPFGRVLIEGMAAGAVVIGTNAGAVPEIVQDGVTGLLIPPNDVNAMAQAIAYALDHPQKRAAWRAAARGMVEKKFTAARTVRGVERVYEEILN